MKFIVVQKQLVSDPDVQVNEEELRLVACSTTREVCAAIREVHSVEGYDWQVHELVNGKLERRAVTFKMDGRHFYDVEVS